MTDLQILFLVLVALYGWECACWTHQGSVAYRTWFGQHFKPAHPARLFGNQRGGFVFAHPLPPLGTLFLSHQFPLSISTEAILAFVSSSVSPGSRLPQSGNLYSFDEIRTVTAHSKRVLINGQIFLRAASPAIAAHIARELEQLKSLPAEKRAKAIQTMVCRSLDIKAIEQRWNEFRNQTRSLRILTNGLFVYLFILIPTVIWKLGLAFSWVGLIAGLLACTTAIGIQFRRLHKQFYPQLEDERFTHFLIILLSPATAVRALDLLSRHLLETYHPIAVASVLCPQSGFRSLAANYLRELYYPALPHCPRPEAAAAQAEKGMRRLLKEEVERVLKRIGLDPVELMRPPIPTESSCRSYCPGCLAQFTSITGTCDDCGGISLAAFEAEANPRKQ